MANKDAKVICDVKKYRIAKGWSQQDLAEKVNVRRQAIYDIESGRYVPNTAIALRMARIFDCRVEDLFLDNQSQDDEAREVRLFDKEVEPSTRLVLGQVRNRLVGHPLNGTLAIPFGFLAADGILGTDRKSANILTSPASIEKTVLLMGCDPAFEILSSHLARLAPEMKLFCRFASSHRALDGLAEGFCHLAGTHLHNMQSDEANVVAAQGKLKDYRCSIYGFSLIEEGLMVAQGNPLGIRTIADLAQPMVRFINREPGAALRVLLDDQLKKAGVESEHINGYKIETTSHWEGAYRIACNVADAALGLRAVADAHGLGFVSIAAVRCDVVVPHDLREISVIQVLLDVLQSTRLKRDLDVLPGYESSITGKHIADI